jgi:hypothetical protein
MVCNEPALTEWLGKSSLLNSLLDYNGLAREVSLYRRGRCLPLITLSLLLTRELAEQQWSGMYMCCHGIPLS